jgi:branched-chain amino acid transport system ATP-binding protein
MAILEVRGLGKRFGGLPAVDDVDLDVESGEVFAIIGPNGAGKSTLLKMVSGMLAPSAGSVLFDGVDITGQAPHRVRHTGIAKVLQTPRVFATMSTRENAALGAMFGGTGRRRSEQEALGIADDVLDMLALRDKGDLPVSSLNLHEKRTLELARALAGRPQILLLDEVMAGLNPAELAVYIAVIRQVRDDLGVTVVWVEHLMKAITALADRVFVLNFGKRLAQGTVDEVLSDPDVVEAYLGRGVAAGGDAPGEGERSEPAGGDAASEGERSEPAGGDPTDADR